MDAAIAELDADACPIRGRRALRRGGWKTRQAGCTSASGALRGPRLGCDGRDTRPTTIQRRSSTGRECRDSTWSRCRDRRFAGGRRRRDHDIDGRTSLRPAGSASSSPVPASRGRDRDPRRSQRDVLNVVEIDADERIVATVAFDLDDFDAAIAELDARYLAGEAAAHAHTWSVIAAAYAALNRRELPPTTPDWVNIDHRRGASFAPGELPAYFRAGWNSRLTSATYIEAVHRLNNLGAVVTHAATWDLARGFRRRVARDRRLDGRRRLGQPLRSIRRGGPRRRDREVRSAQPAGTAAGKRGKPSESSAFEAYFAARDWDAMAEIAGRRHFHRRSPSGRERRRPTWSRCRDRRACERPPTSASRHATSDVIATRGERLVLTSCPILARRRPTAEAFDIDAPTTSSRSTPTSGSWRSSSFDLDDFDAAIAELDARYLAGEAAAHAHTWSVIAGATPRSTGANFPRRRQIG